VSGSFWDYSLAVYARPGVAEACLALQDRFGLDVNILLFCCWAGARGEALGPAALARLLEAAGPWQEQVVKPLRAARRWLKGRPGAEVQALRARIEADELEAERLEQALLAEALPPAPGEASPALAAANLEAYLARLEVRPGAEGTADLAALLAGCFAGLPTPEATRLLR
jgi:uncharacterized protein (TIGR02444 family)